MEAKLRRSNRIGVYVVGVCLLLLLLSGPANSFAHDEWFRGLDLEPALADSSLVLVGRVADVSGIKIMMGGKGESALLQFKFEPVLVLKGVFSRESLSLTSDDLGVRHFADAAPIEPGQLRLLMLGRSRASCTLPCHNRCLMLSTCCEAAVPFSARSSCSASVCCQHQDKREPISSV